MSLTRGTRWQADVNLFDYYCDPVIRKPGRYSRSCKEVPRVARLFIGLGSFDRTKKLLARDWRQTRWNLWVDGHAVNLPPFGTSDYMLIAFPPAGGKNVILRRWDVILDEATPGKHTLRSRSRSASAGTYDATWTFVVVKR
jgi:hypothetical protein